MATYKLCCSFLKGTVSNVVVLANFLSIFTVGTPLPPPHFTINDSCLFYMSAFCSPAVFFHLVLCTNTLCKSFLGARGSDLFRHCQSTMQYCCLPLNVQRGPPLCGVFSCDWIKLEQDTRKCVFRLLQNGATGITI